MNGLQTFKNEQFGEVRVFEQNGAPWFVAADVCNALLRAKAAFLFSMRSFKLSWYPENSSSKTLSISCKCDLFLLTFLCLNQFDFSFQTQDFALDFIQVRLKTADRPF